MTDNDVKFVRADIIAYARKLKLENGKKIWLLGGGEITKEFLMNNLIDEIDLAIHPIILGEGIPLFYSMPKQTYLKLTSNKIHENGLVQLQFNVVSK